MIKEIVIDGRPVAFKASAGIPRLYRTRFGRDILADLRSIALCMQEGREMTALDLTAFENAAYIMAKHAGGDAVPDTPEEWLDGFETFSIYEVVPQLVELWGAGMQTTIDVKKNGVPWSGH